MAGPDNNDDDGDLVRTPAASNPTEAHDAESSTLLSQPAPPTSPHPLAPPLPPRRQISPDSSLRRPDAAQLQAKATTAVSSIDIQTVTFPDGSRGNFSTPGIRAAPSPTSMTSPNISLRSQHGHRRSASSAGGIPDMSDVPTDAMSVMSIAPTMRPPGDLVSLAVGDFHRKSRAWTMLRTQATSVQPFESTRIARVPYSLDDFDKEFDEIPEQMDGDDGNGGDTEAEGNDETRLAAWKAKLKHYMILSSAGKPIWSRHGDLSLVNSYMGIIQTIISFYEGAKNPLQGFTAGNTRFVIVTEGPLYLVAISRLGESDAQLREQLRALYMQILSTLTLPTLTNIFAHRPSTDLRKPLQGTETLLASLADSFTKGSPSAMLGALECLRLRKSQRASITATFLKQRNDKLLYGLIVAGGRLVSVIRPRKHSLHPSDLQLIFNMLFESGGIKSGGGENWIPLCLPAFNNRGYLYMYVSFFDEEGRGEAAPKAKAQAHAQGSSSATSASTASSRSSTKSSTTAGASEGATSSASAGSHNEGIAIILISTDKESFFELREMREKVAHNMTKNGSLALIRNAAAAGRPQVADIVRRPGTAVQISHFLYKSRANVQFAMSAEDLPADVRGPRESRSAREAQRRLMTLYHQLHASVHARHAHLKILHCVGEDATSLAWVTPVFEFYCVAGPNASRAVVTQDANRIIQWAKREEERLLRAGLCRLVC
ncbi:vacuolar fusion protein mon1 [Ophiostoma piceae UAMH 11346]|uniref:Vacuolar fusion protein MON1 n=1 Tax=Ophiostoma piceae (strain UAMH 11346) TaxID=1262450 RepID=S3BW56_OPHP1|nr:vacuolar fusion protein mon1 [Ophiostoma piceae UAMH 11346]